MAPYSAPRRVGGFVLADRVFWECTKGMEDEIRVTQGIPAYGVGDTDELP